MARKDLNTLLDDWSVMDPDLLEDNPLAPKGWWGVTNTQGIIAYFAKEKDAFRFRLAEINRALNG